MQIYRLMMSPDVMGNILRKTHMMRIQGNFEFSQLHCCGQPRDRVEPLDGCSASTAKAKPEQEELMEKQAMKEYPVSR